MKDTDSPSGLMGRPRASWSFDPERMARLMVVAGVDTEKLMADAGVSRSTVARARTGKKLSQRSAQKIGAALARYPQSEILDELLRDPAGVA